jgi:SAM-dependent methyltransferase
LKTASPNGNFDFLKIKAEDLTVDVLPKKEKVDFVAAAECMHWTNAEVAAPRIANVLKPGGTFAAWLYGPRPIVDAKDQDVGKAYDAILDMLFL